MKKLNCTLLAIILLLADNILFAQKPVYNSNNGKYINIRNTNIYYEEYGKGIPLLLLHGGMGSIADYSLCIPGLSKQFHVIAPDDPGMTRSGMYDTISYELLADYFSELIDKLKLDSVYVMGWSDGGNAALILAAKRPDKVKKVVTSGANYKLSGYKFGDPNSLTLVTADYQPDLDQQKWIDSFFIACKPYWKKILNDRIRMWSQEIYFSPHYLEDIKIPVMLVIGDRDGVTLEHGVEMHHIIKGSQFCVLPNTTHNVFNERPQLINELAIEFFKK